MIERLDHVVIGVRDLDEAIRAYQQLGFEVRPGGRHTGLGTHNALIRFGLDYFELLAIEDEAQAMRSGGQGRFMIGYLPERPGALLGFALASDNLEQELARGSAPDVGWDGVGQHPNGACGVAGLRVAARDVPAVSRIYATRLGLAVSSSSVALPNCPIEIVQSEADDEGLVQVKLRVQNLDASRDWFAGHGIELAERSSLPPERSLGAQLVLVE